MSGFNSERKATARKEHTCQQCYRTIHPGETYVRVAGVFFGDFYAFKDCSHCNAFIHIIWKFQIDAFEESSLMDWVHNTGLDPGTVCEFKENALSMYRWSRWFMGQWQDQQGNLRKMPELVS